MEKVLLACPRYKLRGDDRAEVQRRSSTRNSVDVFTRPSSLLAHNCNSLLCYALNSRQERGYRWLAMLHDDVHPEQDWLDKLIAEAIRAGADLLSAVVPLKDNSGFTSTAIAKSANLIDAFTRLTQAQVRHADFPDTFDIQVAAQALERLPSPLGLRPVPRSELWCNTGCMVCRLDPDWDWHTICFASLDAILHYQGRWLALNCSEDWVFSQRVARAGGKVMATRIVHLLHREGSIDYDSAAVWGQPCDSP